VLFWNIEGIGNLFNLDSSERDSTLNCDIICLVETWSRDNFKLTGQWQKYDCTQVNAVRLSNRGRGIGGIIILTDSNKFAVTGSTLNENFIILRVKNTKSNEVIIIANVYIQPQSEKDEALTEFFDTLQQIRESNSNSQLIICGDFNARIGREDMSEINLPPIIANRRLSKDSTINQRGKLLNEIIDSNDIEILNGRTINDIPGNFTYVCQSGSSCIDLFMGNPQVMNCVTSLKVLKFPHSNHFPIQLNLGLFIQNASHEPKIKWNQAKMLEYRSWNHK